MASGPHTGSHAECVAYLKENKTDLHLVRQVKSEVIFVSPQVLFLIKSYTGTQAPEMILRESEVYSVTV